VKFSIFKKQSEKDRLEFIGGVPPRSPKDVLIKKCKDLDVSIHIDDLAENVHTPFRAVASEAELERRVLAKMSVLYSIDSRRLAVIA